MPPDRQPATKTSPDPQSPTTTPRLTIRLIDDEISSCQATAIYAKASEQDRLEAAKVWSWVQERLLNCSRLIYQLAQQINDELKRQLTLFDFGMNGFISYTRSGQGHVYQYSRSIILVYYTRVNTESARGTESFGFSWRLRLCDRWYCISAIVTTAPRAKRVTTRISASIPSRYLPNAPR